MYTIELNPTSPSLKGKYPQGVEVQVMCDCTNGSFSIELPDCKSVVDTKFRFVRKDENRDNNVTFTPFTGQKINNEDSQTMRVGTVIILTTDRNNWW